DLTELALQTHDRLERIGRQGLDAHLRQAQGGVHGGGLIAVGLEFEGLTAVDRGGVDEVGDIGPQRLGDRGQERDRSFSLTVLDRRDLRGRTPDFLPQLVQRQTTLFAKESDSSADAESVRLLFAALDFGFDADQGRSNRFCVPVHFRPNQYDRSAKFLEPEISRLFIRNSPTTALATPTE